MTEWLTLEKLSAWDKSAAEKRGEHIARTNGYSQVLATFLVNLDSPTENPQHKDLLAVEDFLHGYYGYIVEDLYTKLRSSDQAYQELCERYSERMEQITELEDELKNSKGGLVGGRKAARKNSRRSRRRPRRD